MTVGAIYMRFVRSAVRPQGLEPAYPVAIGVFLGLESTSVEKNGSTLLLRSGNEILNSLLALRADDGSEISSLLKSTVHVEVLGSLRKLRQPVLGLPNHYQGAKSHASLTSSAEGGSGNSVQSMVLVAIRQNSSVVFGTQVGLDSLAVGGAPSIDVFTRAVTTDKADGLNSGLIENEIDRLGRSVDNVDHTRWETSLASNLGENHSSTRVALRGLHDDSVTGDGGNWDTPERNHGGEV
jgi:hypothetical protein